MLNDTELLEIRHILEAPDMKRALIGWHYPPRTPEAFEQHVRVLLAEAARVGRVPWSADSHVEREAYWQMNRGMYPPPYPQESMEESIARWTREGRYTGVPGEGPRWHS